MAIHEQTFVTDSSEIRTAALSTAETGDGWSFSSTGCKHHFVDGSGVPGSFSFPRNFSTRWLSFDGITLVFL